ncbi:MAG TPA: family 10 glycosylhydrolase, partial [Oligoflexia bacterium]|nr:family 10 glycosylhydrolase [Oligoflexia bacterium]
MNQPFRSREEFDYFLKFSAEPHFTDLYCQVYRSGRSWYPSVMADAAPYHRALGAGFDPLKETIKTAHQRGQRVHAWVNALRVVHDGSLPLLRTIGSEALQVDHYGNSIWRYNEEGIAPDELNRAYRLETAGVWLDPSSKRVRQFVVEAVRDIITAYPDIDGIHLDMIRYPGTIVHDSSAAPGVR